MLPFHPLTLSDKEAVQSHVWQTDCRNCDLNFMNLVGWRFLYDTEVAEYDGWLLFRFRADGHLAYLAPVGEGDWSDIVPQMTDDAAAKGEPFLMLGVCENSLSKLHAAMPGHFYAESDRNYTDYIYLRERMASLSGKKWQAKRNFVNRFTARYPHYEFLPLTRDMIPECVELESRWMQAKGDETSAGRYTYDAESQAQHRVFDHWDELGGQGGVLRVDGRIVAFTYGAQVNHDTFDICAEKADTTYEGAFAVVNRDFARSLPEHYIYINREEDLGIPGLRQAKLSYHPEILLHKYTVMPKHPFGR